MGIHLLNWPNIWLLKQRCFMSVLLSTLLFSHVANAESDLSKESKLKAAYLLNFTLFISWPEKPSMSPKRTIVLCLDGSNAFVQFARDLASGGKFSSENRLVQVTSLSHAENCDLSFVQQNRLSVPNHIKTSVIVADSESVQTDNTAIIFYRHNRKLRFKINLNVMQDLQVSVSSELLKLAKVRTK